MASSQLAPPYCGGRRGSGGGIRASPRRVKGLTGTVRVTCGSSVAACLRRTPLIDAFHARHPGLRVELVISDRVRA